MALNFSHRHVVSEEPMKIADGYLVEGVSERNGGVFSQPWCSSIEKGDCFDHGKSIGGVFSQPWGSGIQKGDCFDCGRSTGDSVSVDVSDVLPSDPFGMDMNNTFTAISGWLEDLEVDYGRDEIGDGDHHIFAAGLSFIWNNAMRFHEFSESSVYNSGSGSLFGFEEGFDGDGSRPGAFISPASEDKVLSRVENAMRFQEFRESSNGSGSLFGGEPCPGAFIPPTSVNEVLSGENSERCNNDGGDIHPAFGFCLYHLGVKDLLSVSMVCKSLHTTVCDDDSLLWKHIHISQPLNERITDESLLQLTERAHGTMHCLRLVDCSRITEDCLKKVLERNPQLVKLGVPGCTRISIDGLVIILRDLKSAGKLQVKHLETGGLYGVTKDHYDELLDLLDIKNVNKTIQKPRYYHRGYAFSSCDDVQALDIEMCRKCQNWRIVYDCPAEDCKGKEECRACSLCVQRCVQCGRCINGVYEETFCLEFLCSGCSKLLKLPLV